MSKINEKKAKKTTTSDKQVSSYQSEKGKQQTKATEPGLPKQAKKK